jgi:survival of motor neuron-related-splicing factor 30
LQRPHSPFCRRAAVILAISDDGDAFTIRYIGYNDEDVKSRSELKPLESPPGALDPAEVAVGLKCQSLWPGDGRYYDATVEEVTDVGVKVKFVKYGSASEVPVEYLRPCPTEADESGAAPGGKGGPVQKEREGADNFRIPENLRILPTDSEEEKARKRKRLKHLKQAVKRKVQDEEKDDTQNSWKSFLNKSKKPKGLGALKKGSIFASPETVDGKVGVVGSGQGMTDYGMRKKYDLKVPSK